MFQNVSNDSLLGDIQFRNQTLKILHIEDSVADQALARLSLKRGQLPCTLTAVDSLQEVSDALETQEFDLILADYTSLQPRLLGQLGNLCRLCNPRP